MADSCLYVGAVAKKGEEILLVRQSAGHPLEGQWTVPFGRVEPGESTVAAAVRESLEEGGVVVTVDGLLGIQELPAPQAGCVTLAYLCSHVSGVPAPRDRETDAARYFSLHALDALREPMEPWSDWLLRRVFAGNYAVTRANGTSPFGPDGAFL